MDIKELQKLMILHDITIRAIPMERTIIVDIRHKDQFPDGEVTFLPEFKREMLVVKWTTTHAGKFLAEAKAGSSGMVKFSSGPYFDTIEDAVIAAIKRKESRNGKEK